MNSDKTFQYLQPDGSIRSELRHSEDVFEEQHLTEMVRSLCAETPDITPIPDGLYKRILRSLDRLDKQDRRRARMRRKQRRGWA